MRIGIIGTGNVGATLGAGWAKAGHSVKFGIKGSGQAKVAELAKAGGDISSGTVAEAVSHGEVVVFAVPYSALAAVAGGIGDCGDKVLIDVTNPVDDAFEGLVPSESSAAGELAAVSGSSRVVKCFNTVGFNVMANPDFGGRKATMPYCGDDKSANEVVRGLVADLGFDPIDAGPLRNARQLEHLTLLFLKLATQQGYGFESAFIFERR